MVEERQKAAESAEVDRKRTSATEHAIVLAIVMMQMVPDQDRDTGAFEDAAETALNWVEDWVSCKHGTHSDEVLPRLAQAFGRNDWDGPPVKVS